MAVVAPDYYPTYRQRWLVFCLLQVATNPAIDYVGVKMHHVVVRFVWIQKPNLHVAKAALNIDQTLDIADKRMQEKKSDENKKQRHSHTL